MSSDQPIPDEFQEPETKAAPGAGLVLLALIIPIVAGILLCFVTTIGESLTVGFTMVGLTSVLVYLDALRLNEGDPAGKNHTPTIALLIGMVVLWVVCFPYAYFRRRHFASPNLG